MSATVSLCPDADTLEQFLLGECPAHVANLIGAHLSDCAHCTTKLEQGIDDPFVPILRRGSTVLKAVDPTQIELILTRIRNKAMSGSVSPSEDHDFLEAPEAMDELGRVGPYRVLTELGRGGMGVVYLAEDRRLHRLVALKFVLESRLGDPNHQARFDREVAALVRLQHPNVVSVYEAGRFRGRPYLAMEYVRGGTLADLLRGRPAASEVAALLATLADAIHQAHMLGIIHRDLKPSNILFAPAESSRETPSSLLVGFTPKIADFGLAYDPDEASLTLSNDLLGTPGYMAPEMIRGGATTGAKDAATIDVYALGAILYECLTGHAPFRGESVIDVLEQVRTTEPLPPRRLQPKIPRSLETICLKCLAKEPRKRYASAADLAADLRRFLAGEPIHARRAGLGERTLKWVRRKPGWAALLVVSIIGVLTLSLMAVRYERQLRQARDQAEANATETRREREHARANYREARATLEKLLERTNQFARRDLPRLRELRHDQLKDALAFYLAIAEQEAEPDPEVRWDTANARLQASLLQIQLRRGAEAVPNLVQTRVLLKQLLTEYPHEPRYRKTYTEALTTQGLITPGEEGRLLLEEARREAEALVETDPRSTPYRSQVAQICHALGQNAQLEQDKATAARYYERAINIRREMLRETPQWREQRLALGQTQVNLLLVRQTTVPQPEGLEQLVGETAATLEQSVKDDPADPIPLIALSSLRTNWAYQQMKDGATDKAIQDLGKSIEQVERFLTLEPNWSEANHALYSAYGTRAVVFDSLGKYAEAARDFRQVVQRSPTPADRKRNQIDLAGLLIHAKDFTAAARETEKAVSDPTPVPNPGALKKHLSTCATLTKVRYWGGFQPFRTEALQAAKRELEQTRKALDAATWRDWLTKVRRDSDSARFLDLPELKEHSR